MAGRLTALQALRNVYALGPASDSVAQQEARLALVDNGYDWQAAQRAVAKAWHEHFAISEAN